MEAHIVPSAHPVVVALRQEFPEWWRSVEDSGGGLLLVAREPQSPCAGESPDDCHQAKGPPPSMSAAGSQWCLAPLQSSQDAAAANLLQVRS